MEEKKKLSNLPAAFTSGDPELLHAAQQDSSCAQVIPCNWINLLTLTLSVPLGYNKQAEYIFLTWNRIEA